MATHHRDLIQRTQLGSHLAGEHVLSLGECVGSRKIATFMRGLDSGRDMVLLSSNKVNWPHLVSGLELQRRMKLLGVPVPSVIRLNEKSSVGEQQNQFCVLVNKLPGLNIQRQWEHLSKNTTLNLAHRIAGIVHVSTQALQTDLDPQGNRFGMHIIGEQPEYDGMAGYLLGRLKTSENRIQQRRLEELNSMIKNLKAHLEQPSVVEFLNGAPRSMFVYDLLDRNFLVLDEVLSGVVDMDEIFTGDKALIPAVADVFLSRTSFKYRRDYIETWSEAWNLQGEDRKRMSLYRAVMAVDRESVAGTQNRNGVIRAPVPQEFLTYWVKHALSTTGE